MLCKACNHTQNNATPFTTHDKFSFIYKKWLSVKFSSENSSLIHKFIEALHFCLRDFSPNVWAKYPQK